MHLPGRELLKDGIVKDVYLFSVDSRAYFLAELKEDFPLPEGFASPKAGVCRFGFVETDRDITCSVENGMLIVPVTENEKNLYIAVYQPA